MTAEASGAGGRRILAIAGFTWLEARRTHLPWIVIASAAIVLAGSVFARSLALTEGARVQIAFLASGARAAAVFIVCLHVLSSMLREWQDKGTALLLSLDIPRAGYLGGKAAGYFAVAAAVSILLWIPVAVAAPGAASWGWLVTLILETWVVAAAALFCAVTLNHLLVGTAFVLGFDILGRSMSALYLMATASPYVGSEGVASRWVASAVRGAYLLLPGLDQFARTDWLTEVGPAAAALMAIAAEALAYVAVLLAAALVDLSRKNT